MSLCPKDGATYGCPSGERIQSLAYGKASLLIHERAVRRTERRMDALVANVFRGAVALNGAAALLREPTHR